MASLNRMNQLLSWSTKNQVGQDDPEYVPPRPLEQMDPELIDMILGKPDAVRMKEAMTIAVDEQKSEEQRVQALDDLELLVESLDNANDMEAVKLWEPLISLFQSTSSAVAMQALWVAGTAIQNNPQSQAAFLSHNPIQGVIGALSTSTSTEVRGKAVYCLSGALRHNRAAVITFTDAKGWPALKTALADSSIAVRRKVAFLFNTLILPDPDSETPKPSPEPSPMVTSDLTRAAIKSNDIFGALASSIISPHPFGSQKNPVPDIDYEEKAMRTIVTYLAGKVPDADETSGEKASVNTLLDFQKTERGVSWGLDPPDWELLERSI